MNAAERTVLGRCPGWRAPQAPRACSGGIPVEYKGGTISAPDQRRSYS
ncbi:hypothetical protein [Aeromicrobium halocynthiae]